MTSARGLYFRHPSSFQHETGPHPENKRRIAAIEEELSEREWMGLEVVEAPAAERSQLERVHDPAHIDRIEALAADGGGMIDMDTVASAGSWDAALHAAGGAVAAVDRLLEEGAGGFAISALRPPGHHAEAGRAMGFCLFNNVAIAAAHALARLEEGGGAGKALILDWDVHHGNGTEAIFYSSDEVLYASIHQSPLYPGTGAATDTGEGDGEGYTLNIPVAPGAGNAEFLAGVERVAGEARELQPGILFVSAGYDGHRDDPLAQCEVDEGGYREMASAMRALGEELGVPVVVCLEGGYSLDALASSVVATVDGLQPG